MAGRSLIEIDGVHSGRLASGIVVAALQELPVPPDFNWAASSQVAGHRFHRPAGVNVDKVKADARSSGATTGLERVVKVLPVTRHHAGLDSDVQNPPGQGAAQGISRVPLKAGVIGTVAAYRNGRYQPADVVHRY